jgi:hypothetical protein
LDKKATIVAKLTFEKDVDAAHKALISEYRSQIYDELRNNFVKRYLGR